MSQSASHSTRFVSQPALAAQIMQAYLDKNTDSDLQEIYLNQLHHQVLWRVWQERNQFDE